MTEDAVFIADGTGFMPMAVASGPWGTDRLHGGPVLGLLVRAIELAVGDPELVLARISIDLYRPVPLAKLEVQVRVLRRGARLNLLEASLLVAGEEYARANALLLRADDVAGASPALPTPPRPFGPDGLPTESLARGLSSSMPPGFHSRVETRWVPRATVDEPLAIWFRLPLPLVAAELDTPLRRAATLADFANAISSIAARERTPGARPYINADSTLYLFRQPRGEWICLQEHACDAERAISVSEMLLFDADGLFGRALQARLVNRFKV